LRRKVTVALIFFSSYVSPVHQTLNC